MCGRFCCSRSPKEIVNELQKEKYCNQDISVECDDYTPSYNVFPASNILVYFEKDSQKKLKTMKWGYIPFWAKKLPLQTPINARSDTLEIANNFFSSSINKRCVVIAEGFFEWKKQDNKKKQVFYVKRKDNKLMAFAGLYDMSKLIEKTYSCVIITTKATKSFSEIHNRMPVILNESNVNTWIDSNKEWKENIVELMKPVENELEFYQVSNDVGSIKNNSARLIAPMDSQRGSIMHFFSKKKED